MYLILMISNKLIMRVVIVLISRIFIISVLEIVNISVKSCDQKGSNVHAKSSQGYFTKNIEDFELIHPKKVSDKGEFITHFLPHFHEDDTLDKIKKGELHPEAASVHYHVPLNGKTVQVKLNPNPIILPSSMVVEHRNLESEFDIGRVKLKRPQIGNCYYNGKITDEPDSKVALSTCNGLAGFIKSKDGEFLIEPIQSYNPLNQDHPHMLFKKRENGKSKDKNCIVSKGKKKKKKAQQKKEKVKINDCNQDTSSKLKNAYKNSNKVLFYNDKYNQKITSNLLDKKNFTANNAENNVIIQENVVPLQLTLSDSQTACYAGSDSASHITENYIKNTSEVINNSENVTNDVNFLLSKSEEIDVKRPLFTLVTDSQIFKRINSTIKYTENDSYKGRGNNLENLSDLLEYKKKIYGDITRLFKNENNTGTTRKPLDFYYSFAGTDLNEIASTNESIESEITKKVTKFKSDKHLLRTEQNPSGDKKSCLKQSKETTDKTMDEENYMTELLTTEISLKNNETYNYKKIKSSYNTNKKFKSTVDKSMKKLKSENNSDWDSIVKEIKMKDKSGTGKLIIKDKNNKSMKSRIYNKNVNFFQKTDGIKNTRTSLEKQKFQSAKRETDRTSNYNNFVTNNDHDNDMVNLKRNYNYFYDENEPTNKKKENQFSESVQFINERIKSPQAHKKDLEEEESLQIYKENLRNLTNGLKPKRSAILQPKSLGCKKSQSECTPRGLEQSWDLRMLIVVSYHFSQRHKDTDLESFILTIVNMISTNFHDASLGLLLDVKLVRMVFIEFRMEELDEEKLSIEQLFENFCLFQHRINPVKGENPFHHDIGIYIISLNQCGGNTMMGVTNKGSVCQSKDSCIVSIDEGLLLGNIITHQIGHSLGANHDDGGQESCQPSEPDGSVYYHMNPIISMNSTQWSRCSSQAMQRFIRNQGEKCLERMTTFINFDWPDILPGQIYDPVQQCDLNFHLKTLPCYTGDFCKFLYCQANPNQCVSLMVPPADGTICAFGMWCMRGSCVSKGRHPGMVNGEWSQWGQWSSCSRTCSAGVQHAYRLCNNPSPSLGGRYCVGRRIRHQMCNYDVSCDRYALSYRDYQCTGTNHIPFRNLFYTWRAFHNMFEYVECSLICETYSGIVAVRNLIANDGTPCKPGTQNVCVQGRCMEIGCDWGINSDAVRDACGKCHGNGTDCRIIQGVFNEKHGSGYVPFLKVPKGSGMVYAREINPSDAILVVSSYNSENFYLNGPLESVEPRPAEYDFGNTRGVYSIRGKMERVFIPGPTKEDLVFYVKFGCECNPGIRYQFALPEKDPDYIPQYSWQFIDWDLCSDACGGGQQKARARCVEDTAGVVETRYCLERERPLDIIRSCNEFPCYPKWWVGAWSECVVVGCESVRYRTVLCMRTRDPNSLRTEILKDKYCCDEEKPALVRRCNETVDEIPLETCGREDVFPTIINIEELESEFDDLDGKRNIINKDNLQKGFPAEMSLQHQGKGRLGVNATKHPEEVKLINKNLTTSKMNLAQSLRRKETNARSEVPKRWHGRSRFHQPLNIKEGIKDYKMAQNSNVHILNQEKKSNEKNASDRNKKILGYNNSGTGEATIKYLSAQKGTDRNEDKPVSLGGFIGKGGNNGDIKFGGTTCSPHTSYTTKKPKPLHLPSDTTCTPKCTTCPVIIKFTYPPKDLILSHPSCPIIDQVAVHEFAIALIPIVCQVKSEISPTDTFFEIFHQTGSWPYGKESAKTIIKGRRAMYFLSEMRDNATLHPFVFHAENKLYESQTIEK